MAKKFLGFMRKDAPDEVIVAYIKEAGKIAMEWTGDDKALSLALSPVWEKHFGQAPKNPPLAVPNE